MVIAQANAQPGVELAICARLVSANGRVPAPALVVECAAPHHAVRAIVPQPWAAIGRRDDIAGVGAILNPLPCVSVQRPWTPKALAGEELTGQGSIRSTCAPQTRTKRIKALEGGAVGGAGALRGLRADAGGGETPRRTVCRCRARRCGSGWRRTAVASEGRRKADVRQSRPRRPRAGWCRWTVRCTTGSRAVARAVLIVFVDDATADPASPAG